MSTHSPPAPPVAPSPAPPHERAGAAAPAGTLALIAWIAGRGPVPAAETLREAELAAYAYATLPASHPERAALRGDFLATLDRQLRTRHELAPLVAAWRGAGIDVLLFKGFALGEFVYPTPGCRWALDADVLVPAEHAERAESIARRLGWQSDRFIGAHRLTGSTRTRTYHAVAELSRPQSPVRIDLHQAALHTRVYRHSADDAPSRITRALWAASEERPWEGTTVRVPSPVDAALVGVVLQRAWGGDRWRVRPRDLLDLRVLADRAGVTRAALEARARELGCARTLAAFLDRCEGGPAAAHLFATPGPHVLRRLDRVALPERGLLGLPEMIADGLRIVPGLAAAVLAVLPDLVRARRALGRHRDIHALLRALDPDARPARLPDDADTGELFRVYQGAVWTTRLVPDRQVGRCLYVSLVLYAALRRRGFAAVLVTGVRRDGGGIAGHAWVELGDQVLDPVGGTDRRDYVVSLRHPAPDEAPRNDSAEARQTPQR